MPPDDSLPAAASRLLIHVGYHKTGTTWLQQHLFGRFDRGFSPVLPKQGADAFHNADRRAKSFSMDFVSAPGGERCLHPLEFDAARLRRRYATELEWDVSGVPVLSSERLSGNPHAGGFDCKEIAERLHQVFPAARIFLVLREQRSMILSTYYQYLKAGGTLSLAAYVGQKYDGRLPGFSLAHLEYDRLIAHYQRLFGRERVLVSTYERFVREPEAFIAALSAFGGAIVPPGLEFGRVENEGRNRLIESRLRHLNLVCLRDSLNGYSPLYVRGSGVLVRALKRSVSAVVPQDAVAAHVARQREEIAALVGDRYRRSNALTSRLIGADLAAYGYAVDPPSPARREVAGA